MSREPQRHRTPGWLRLAAVALLALAAAGWAQSVSLSVLLEARAASGRALSLLLTRQRADGSWAGDPLTTAHVLICLANAPSLTRDTRALEALSRAETFLQRGVEQTTASLEGSATTWATSEVAMALTALARRDPALHRDLLARGRALLLAQVQPVALAGGAPAIGFPAHAGATPDVPTTCAVLDALLLSEGLEPAWLPDGYAQMAAYLQKAQRDLLRRGGGAATPGAAGAIPPEPAASAATLARALLSLGVPANGQPLAAVLEGLARSPPADPAAAFNAAEALRLADLDAAGWRERYAEALLGTQQGDGGWAGPSADEPRDGATAMALRCLQVAIGRYLDEAATP